MAHGWVSPMKVWIPLMGFCLSAFATPFPTGEPVPSVVCAESKEFSYALYLPHAYPAAKAWPVLFCFDPGGRAEMALSLFTGAAEQRGYLVVVPRESRNGLPDARYSQIGEAVFQDVSRRFKIDARRCYLAGMSGGSRVALAQALEHPKRFAGVISEGAFFDGSRRSAPDSLCYFLVSGDSDFNHWEMQEARQHLIQGRRTFWQEEFPGGHRWAPEGLCAQALEFLDLVARRERLMPPDSAADAAFSQKQYEASLGLELSGSRLFAMRKYEDIARVFPEQPAGQRAQKRARELRADPELKAQLVLEKDYDELGQKLEKERFKETYWPRLRGVADTATKGSAPASRWAKALVSVECESLRNAAGTCLKGQDWDRAAFLYQALSALEKESNWNPWCAARAQARLGRKTEALAFLKLALERGFRDLSPLQSEPDLASLRETPEFQALLGQLK